MQTNNSTLQHLLNIHHCTAQTAYTQSVPEQLKICRTKALGYHLYKCDDDACGKLKYQYYSCRNRHCPQCGTQIQLLYAVEKYCAENNYTAGEIKTIGSNMRCRY